MNYVGLDIGGANIKVSDARGHSGSRPFALWKYPDRLSEALEQLLEDCITNSGMIPADAFAVTMTGELADCFRTKAEGVDRILSTVERIAGDRPIRVWQMGGEFVTPDEARDTPLLVAAANWHLLSTYAGRFVPEGTAIMIDIGSTTTDIIPLEQGLPASAGLTDRERLASGELVYTGISRTPICAVCREVRLGTSRVSFAAELFATMRDVYLWQRRCDEDAADCDTANDRPATRHEAADRLARMICCDRTEITDAELDDMTLQISQSQRSLIHEGLDRVFGRLNEAPHMVLISGTGEFLARDIVEHDPRFSSIELVSLTAAFGKRTSAAACAHAAACLAHERLGNFP
ncbi:MAG: hydantoinase/oxoprolinase family protein [Planctomycetaceae bacterium]